AREIAAVRGEEIRLPDIQFQENDEDVNGYIRISIEAPDLCLRYCARVIKNVRPVPSPEWLQQRLISAGVRPVNVPVDVTNYVMLEYNQPLHAFDYDLLDDEHHIIVRRAHDGETIVTLDEVERKLDRDTLLITDNGRPVALAGIMGGQNTMINDDTRNILLESACFQNTSVRRSSHRVGLRSDSSVRFEKGTDPNGCARAADRAAMLMQELGGGEIVGGVADAYPQPVAEREICLRYGRIERILGIALDERIVTDCFKRLRFACAAAADSITVTVPTYRPDITGEEDLIEEIARLYGYDNIPATMPSSSSGGGWDDEQKFRDELRAALAARMREIISYSFINLSNFDKLQLKPEDALRRAIKIANPLSEEQGVMRTLLLPGLLETTARNLARKNENVAFFELGSVYYPPADDIMPVEKLKLGAIVAGQTVSGWHSRPRPMDFYYLKGILEQLCARLNIRGLAFAKADHPSWHPGRSALVLAGDKEIGILGEVHPLVRSAYDIKPRVCALEIDVRSLYEAAEKLVMNEPITKYPEVERDLALIVERGLPVEELLAVIREYGGELLRKVDIFDVYTGEPVAADKKSVALRLSFRSYERTLTEEEVSGPLNTILAMAGERLGAVLR
ncbi:MAG: phenylalanine--tRNA ligase subunit beta, partial [Syntrophomonadaceae bacterium]|nr:phenylalanine--tRNA ligase subunit beta [Syntrophomonadaceae bacterium]